MGALRSRRFLRCFYCGQKSTIQFTGQKSFDCSSCDAPNWLDQNGEITDPPAVAENHERNHIRYATSLPSSSFRSPSPTDPTDRSTADESIFCASCLRNQQMLRSSLAQFEWNDDDTSAEQIARDRTYRTLKKSLEERYPQVCEQCAEKVYEKLDQASYTAQTDHLRRLMDRTRSQQLEVKRYGILDYTHYLGRLSWHIGFALQVVWHVVVVVFLLTAPYASTQDGHGIAVALGAFHRMGTRVLPDPEQIMWWAIQIGVGSFPWNPRFPETIRGPRAGPILGYRRWYTYQLLVLAMRYAALRFAQSSMLQRLPAATQLIPLLMILGFTIYIYLTARKSLHSDSRPLFQRPERPNAGTQTQRYDRSVATDTGDLRGILDDISNSIPAQQDQAAAVSPQSPTFLPPTAELQGQRGIGNSAMYSSMQPLQESDATHPSDEMDWSPSASQHRAFSSYNPYRVKNTNPRFSDTPIAQKSGPIWYKVPPAPTNPAQRLRNPPMRPMIRESPKEKKENFFRPTTGRQPLDFGMRSQEGNFELNMARPRFYAPEPKDDPRDTLSNLFATSFSLSPGPEDEREVDTQKRGSSNLQASNIPPGRGITRCVESMVLIAALCGWIFAPSWDEHYGRCAALASLCVCLLMSIRLMKSLNGGSAIRSGPRLSRFAPSLANLAMAECAATIILMWKTWPPDTPLVSLGAYGNALFGGIIAHRIWHIFA
ncbi:hypothetical protein F4777DRAFT_532170 [Nemania sp. FL0916]|nr:hypothetical protein F4777DRAFT_532170 [Nemania sp. FL0916]